MYNQDFDEMRLKAMVYADYDPQDLVNLSYPDVRSTN